MRFLCAMAQRTIHISVLHFSVTRFSLILVLCQHIIAFIQFQNCYSAKANGNENICGYVLNGIFAVIRQNILTLIVHFLHPKYIHLFVVRFSTFPCFPVHFISKFSEAYQYSAYVLCLFLIIKVYQNVSHALPIKLMKIRHI